MALITNPHLFKPYNEVLIQSDTESEDQIILPNVTLFKDSTYDKHRSKRIYGTVVALPYKLSPSRMHQVDDGYPAGAQYYPGEVIRHAVIKRGKQLRRKLSVAEKQSFKKNYSSGTYEPHFTRLNDQTIRGKAGDRAYFHYLALSNDTYVGQDEHGKRYYRVPYENIFCFIRDGGVTMVNGYMQVLPFWDEDYEEIEVDGQKIRGKLKGNLVVGLKEAPEFRTGVILHRGQDFGEDSRRTVYVGDKVVYSKGSEFKNIIEGREVYLMRQWHIIAKYHDRFLLPVGNYVQLRVKKKEGVIISIRELLEEKATVLAKGENCEYVSVGDEVIFNTNAEFFNVDDTIFIKEGQIMAKYED